MEGRSIRTFGADRWALVIVLALVAAVNVASMQLGGDDSTNGQFARIAFNIVTKNVHALTLDEAGEPVPTIIREPVQSAFLALGMALFMTPDRQDIGCLFENPTPCSRLHLSLRVMQALVILAMALMIYGAAARLCGRGWWPVTAVALFLFQGNAIADAAMTFRGEPTAAFLLLGHAYLLALVADDPQRRVAAILAGVALGLLVLTKAIFIFYIVGGIALLGLLTPFSKPRRHVAFRPALIVMLVAFAIMSAWIVRNIVVVGTPMLTQRGNGVLVRRAEHGFMNWKEVAGSFVYYAPYIGPDLAKAWLDPERYMMLPKDNPEGYHFRMRDGGGLVNARTAANIEAGDPRFTVLIRVLTPLQVMIEHLPKQLVLSASFMWRGMGMGVLNHWTGIDAVDRIIGIGAQIFTILLIPAVIWASVRAARRRRWPVFLFLLPGLYGFLIHATITHDLPRFNAPVIPCAIVALCWILHDLTSARRGPVDALSPG